MPSKSRINHNVKKTPVVSSNIQLYIKHSPLLVLAIICFLWIVKIITTQDPSEVANFVIHQLYLPLITPFFLFITFLFSYLTLNIKKGGVIAIFTTLLLLFRLQQIQFEAWWVVPFFITFGVFIILSKKTKNTSKRKKLHNRDKSKKD